MKNVNEHVSYPYPENPQVLEDNSVEISKTSYRGFVSIDQEMVRGIAMNFLDPLKTSIRCQKGFMFVKN